MNVELELNKYLTTMTLQQKQAVLAFVKVLVEQLSLSKEKADKSFSALNTPQTEAEKEVAWLLANTDKGQPHKLLQYAGTLSGEDANAVMAAINDPVYGCNKIDEDEW